MLRRRRDPLAHVHPDQVPPRWRAAVEVALAHRARFAEMRDLAMEGPTRDRIVALADRVDAGVLAVWDLVQRGMVAERVLATIDPERSMDQLKEARRRSADPAEVELLAGRHAAAQRVWNEVEDLGNRLDGLDARLGAVVAHAAELAAGTSHSLDVAVADLDAAIDQLAATRAALAELDQT